MTNFMVLPQCSSGETDDSVMWFWRWNLPIPCSFYAL